MKLTGKITKVLPIRTGMSKKGSTWAAQQYVLDAGNDVCILLDAVGQKEIDSFAITEGETLSITFTPKVVESGDRFFGKNSITGVERPESESIME